METLEIVLIVLAALTLLPVAVVAIEAFAAAIAGRSDVMARSAEDRASVAVIVPAHNEAGAISDTVRHLKGKLRDGDRLVVVADNCTDQTAVEARAAGAEVIERFDAKHRGKGFALAAGVDALRADRREIVIIVDADCRLEPGAIDALVEQVKRTGLPAQAAYVMEAPDQPTARDAVSGFAFVFKNIVRPSGLSALGQPCLLTGTGMAFPWEAIEKAQLATGDIVEDMRTGVELAIAGHPPHFCPPARVLSMLPSQRSAAAAQRTRWEHGHLMTMLRFVPRLMFHAITRFRFNLLSLAAELSVPPLSLLVTWMFLLTAGAIVFAAMGHSALPAVLAGAGWGLLLLAVFVGWLAFARDVITLPLLLTTPMYMLWKVPMYARFLVKPQKQWVRTERGDEDEAPPARAGDAA